ncbi:uncharacterized protein IL334_000933 [Kwoniella shivajii]|uniref:SET domain-containing protein n=1 Tax=Kwoniella shivajii TaxID=564305 RepID=A0ABZ1CQS2_9TREE|nr:hypothetical protein IL334_000933 [Kwoniella shivajii]
MTTLKGSVPASNQSLEHEPNSKFHEQVPSQPNRISSPGHTSSTLNLPIPAPNAIEVLHQLCAFEQAFQDILSTQYGLKRGPIKASLKTPSIDLSPVMRCHFAHHQSSICSKRNLVSRKWLQIIEGVFQDFLFQYHVHLQPCPELDNQAGMYVSKDYITGKSKSVKLSAIQFVLFSFPSEIDDVEELGFSNSLTFDYQQTGQDIVLIGLGPARAINHSCKPNVHWDFHDDALAFEPNSPLEDIGYMILPMTAVEETPILPGHPLSAFYGDHFAKSFCVCKHTTYHRHPRPLKQDCEDSSSDSSDSEYDYQSDIKAKKRRGQMKQPRFLASESIPSKPGIPHKRPSSMVVLEPTNKCPKIPQQMYTLVSSEMVKQESKPGTNTTSSNPDSHKRGDTIHATANSINSEKITSSYSSSSSASFDSSNGSRSVFTVDRIGTSNMARKVRTADPQLMEAFLNAQKIVINQQEVIKAQISRPGASQSDLDQSQLILKQNQATHDRLSMMIWGE